MYDEIIISSDDDDDCFIDSIFEELGTSVKQEVSQKSQDEKPPSQPMSLPDDELPLNKFKDKRNSTADFVTSLSIEIPSIFLLEGERNTRILRQDEEIAKQLAEEEEKARIKFQTLENEKVKILEELNDNGSNFQYSWKNDSKIIEEYIQKSLSKDLSMVNSRQFYFFDDVQTPFIEEISSPITSLLKTALKFSTGDPDQFLQTLRASSISLPAFIVASLTSVSDLPSLAWIEKIVRRDYDNNNTRISHDAPLNESKNCALEKPSFVELMKAIGARPFENSDFLAVKLKLVHYNNYTSLLLLRLSIIFIYYLPRTTTKNDFVLLFRYFYLSCSDFHINKRENLNLRKNFVGPIFEIFAHECSLKFGPRTFVDEAHKILCSIAPSLYDQEVVQSQKGLEIHFNMLLNLLYSVPPNKEAFAYVKELIFKFFEVRDEGTDLFHVAKIIKDMCRLSLMTKVDTVLKYQTSVYKNFYKVHLISVFIHFYVSDESHQNSQELLKCQEELLLCKDVYQSVIGHLSFSADENTREKSRISLVLSDTYHMLDYMVNVLSKSGVLPERDFFYGK